LNALFLQQGHDAKRIRGMQRDLRARTQLAITGGLRLRLRTAEHLASMVGNREYLITRLWPRNDIDGLSDKRLTATLNEVARKVSGVLKPPRRA